MPTSKVATGSDQNAMAIAPPTAYSVITPSLRICWIARIASRKLKFPKLTKSLECGGLSPPWCSESLQQRARKFRQTATTRVSNVSGRTGSLSSSRAAMYCPTASRAFSIASSRLRPCVMHPGRLGHSATHCPSSPRLMTIWRMGGYDARFFDDVRRERRLAPAPRIARMAERRTVFTASEESNTSATSSSR